VSDLPEIVPAVVAATPEEQIVRTEVRHGFPPKSWHEGRVVLLGDSAHTLSPFAGMGACPKTGRRNEWMMMPTKPLLYWARNAAFTHTTDEKAPRHCRGDDERRGLSRRAPSAAAHLGD